MERHSRWKFLGTLLLFLGYGVHAAIHLLEQLTHQQPEPLAIRPVGIASSEQFGLPVMAVDVIPVGEFVDVRLGPPATMA